MRIARINLDITIRAVSIAYKSIKTFSVFSGVAQFVSVCRMIVHLIRTRPELTIRATETYFYCGMRNGIKFPASSRAISVVVFSLQNSNFIGL